MSALQGASLPPLSVPAALAGQRTTQQGEPRFPGDNWQHAFRAAAQDGGSAPPHAADEAARLLSLGNLEVSPAAVLATPLAGQDVDAGFRQHASGLASQARGTAVAPTSGCIEHGIAGAAATRSTEAARPLRSIVEAPQEAATVSRAAPSAAAARGGLASQVERSSSSRTSRYSHPEAVSPTSTSQTHSGAPSVAAQQAVASYAAAMSAAHAPSEHTADFSLASPSSTLPVRVHVQWRDRVADVWIGLQRKAFDQLPDIRAGVEDWVRSRGGVLGHVVCNGETLTRVAPSLSFLGAL